MKEDWLEFYLIPTNEEERKIAELFEKGQAIVKFNPRTNKVIVSYPIGVRQMYFVMKIEYKRNIKPFIDNFLKFWEEGKFWLGIKNNEFFTTPTILELMKK
jgi:hypothetical protein